MAMTAKHFAALADVISEERANFPTDLSVQNALDNVTFGMAKVFKADNPRFDRDRFLVAAGVTE